MDTLLRDLESTLRSRGCQNVDSVMKNIREFVEFCRRAGGYVGLPEQVNSEILITCYLPRTKLTLRNSGHFIEVSTEKIEKISTLLYIPEDWKFDIRTTSEVETVISSKDSTTVYTRETTHAITLSILPESKQISILVTPKKTESG